MAVTDRADTGVYNLYKVEGPRCPRGRRRKKKEKKRKRRKKR